MTESKPLSEAEVRALRDQVFDRHVTDAGWEATRKRWLRPENIDWLKQHATNTFNHSNPQNP